MSSSSSVAALGKWAQLVAESLGSTWKQASQRGKERALSALSASLSEEDKKRFFYAPSSITPALEGRKELGPEAVTIPEPAVAIVNEKQLEKSHHPVYGELLADLGYKKLFAASPEKVSDRSLLPIWEKQRVFREDRSQKIAADKRDNPRFGFPGVISVFEVKGEAGALQSGQEKGIIDGQHRAEAIKILSQSSSLSPSERILVEVFPVDREDEVSRLFLEINKAEPVKLIDLPDAAPASEKLIIDQAVAMMEAAFPGMFKSSSRCRRPSVHADTLRDELFRSEVVSRMDMKTADELYQWLQKKNSELSRYSDDEWVKAIGSDTKKATKASLVKKARQSKFFLGMTMSWLHES